MALFKILRGSSENFTTDLTQSNVSPAFHDGYCYFIVDTGLFYVDYENNGNKYRIPLNAGDAKSILGATLEHNTLHDSEVEIPSSALLYAVKNAIEESIASLEARKANKDAYYTKAEIDAYELITVEDIDTICNTTNIVVVGFNDEVRF